MNSLLFKTSNKTHCRILYAHSDPYEKLINDGHKHILSLLIWLTDNKYFHLVLPSILVEEEVLEDDWANEDLQLTLVDQIVD